MKKVDIRLHNRFYSHDIVRLRILDFKFVRMQNAALQDTLATMNFSVKPYYRLLDSIKTPWCISLDAEQKEELNYKLRVSFITGHSISQNIPMPLRFTTDSKLINHPPHYLVGDTMIVVSTKFLEALKAADVDNFQVFPAEIHCVEENITFNDYFAINIIGVCDVIDEARSKGTEILPGSGQMSSMIGFDEIVFSAEKLKSEPKLFRIPQDKTMLFIHDDIHESLKRHAPPAPERWGIVQRKIDIV